MRERSTGEGGGGKGRIEEVEKEGKKSTGGGEHKKGAGEGDWRRKRERKNEGGGRGSISKCPTKREEVTWDVTNQETRVTGGLPSHTHVGQVRGGSPYSFRHHPLSYLSLSVNAW